ncbi:MAG TPA: DUF805 domain-containing protein [Anaerolineales bacterium]|nr:DUF805 domain-containing protein [Anaerolineales bacterium]
MDQIKENFNRYFMSQLNPYFNFDGRLGRRDFWMFVLINFVISLLITLVFSSILRLGWVASSLSGIYSLAILIPGLGVSIRRLHDVGKSGMWILIGLIPLIGLLVLLYFYLQDSQPGDNQYGASPVAGGNVTSL